ncbi:MAG: YoaK family protein [Minicystis sp.]
MPGGVDSPANEIAARVGVAAALAFVSGAVDVIGWLSLDHIYTTHMTGNSAALGQAMARGDMREIVTRGLPIMVFVAGVIGGAALAGICVRRGVRAAVAPGLALTAALLGGFLVWASTTAHAGPIPLEPAWMFNLQATGSIWPSFVAGAVTSALAYARWRVHALAIPLLLLVSLVVLDLAWPVGGPRGTAAWRREQRRRSGE